MSYRTWDAICVVRGVAYPVVGGLPTRTLSLSGRQSATVQLATMPPDALRAPAFINVQINGVWRRFFTGIVEPHTVQIGQRQNQLTLVDVVDSQNVVDDALAFADTPYADGLRDVAALCGIPASLIDAIADPLAGYDPAVYNGATYSLGVRAALEGETLDLEPGEGLWSIFEELLRFGGLRLCILPSGHVRFVLDTSVPRDATSMVYSSEIGEGRLGITNAGVSVDGTENVLWSFFASGPNPSDGSSNMARATRGGSQPIVRDNFRFAEWAWVCKLIADRELARRARNAVTYWFEAPLNLDIVPGMTIGFWDDRFLATNGLVRGVVTSVSSTEAADMRVEITTGPSLIFGYNQTQQDSGDPPDVHTPIPDATTFALRHPINGTEETLVQCVGESLSTIGAAITSHSWLMTGYDAVIDPSPVFRLASTTGATVALTVTDANSVSESVTRRVVDPLTNSGRRTLYSARGSAGWHIRYDGVWRSYTSHTPDCTAVLSYQRPGAMPALAGYADGTVWRSDDYLQSPPTMAAMLLGSVTCIVPAPWNASVVLVGHGARVSQVDVTRETFGLLHEFTYPVRAIYVRPRTMDIMVAAGPFIYQRTSGGWAVRPYGNGSNAALAFARTHNYTAMLFETTIPSQALAFIELPLTNVRWNNLDPADRPGTLRSITPILSSPDDLLVSEAIQFVADDLCPGVIHTLGAGRVWRLRWIDSGYTPELVGLHGAHITTAEHIGVITLPHWAYGVEPAPTLQIGCGPLATVEA